MLVHENRTLSSLKKKQDKVLNEFRFEEWMQWNFMIEDIP